MRKLFLAASLLFIVNLGWSQTRSRFNLNVKINTVSASAGSYDYLINMNMQTYTEYLIDSVAVGDVIFDDAASQYRIDSVVVDVVNYSVNAWLTCLEASCYPPLQGPCFVARPTPVAGFLTPPEQGNQFVTPNIRARAQNHNILLIEDLVLDSVAAISDSVTAHRIDIDQNASDISTINTQITNVGPWEIVFGDETDSTLTSNPSLWFDNRFNYPTLTIQGNEYPALLIEENTSSSQFTFPYIRLRNLEADGSPAESGTTLFEINGNNGVSTVSNGDVYTQYVIMNNDTTDTRTAFVMKKGTNPSLQVWPNQVLVGQKQALFPGTLPLGTLEVDDGANTTSIYFADLPVTTSDTVVIWSGTTQLGYRTDIAFDSDITTLQDSIAAHRIDIDALESSSHAAVTLAGENYLSLSTQQITANPINLASTNVTGVLPVTNFDVTGNWTGTFDGQEGSWYSDYNNLSNSLTFNSLGGGVNFDVYKQITGANEVQFRSLVQGSGITLVENANDISITLDATGDWTGTLDGYEGAALDQDLTIDSTGRVFTLGITGGNTVKFTDQTGTDDQNITGGSFATGTGNLTIGIENGSSQIINLDGRYLTSFSETNDLSSVVTWANVPDANITQSSVTQHQAALTITESQISDLQAYLTSEIDPLFSASTVSNIIDGTGFLKNDGLGNWTYDNSTYLTSYTETDPIYSAWDKSTGISITESQISDFGTYEPAFSKNTAFNKNFGTISGTVVEGNDSRILNGQTAFGWGDHALAGYLTSEVDGSITNELQNLTIDSTGRVFTLGITDGNSITFTDQTGTDDQTLSLVTNTLSIEDGNSVDLSGYVNTDAQTLAIDGSDNLSITGGNSVSLSPYLDNTDNQTLSIDSTGRVFTISISGGNSIVFTDTDTDTQNPFQTLSWSAGAGGNDEITLSNGGGTITITDNVNDADFDPANEIQTISLATNTLSLSDGGGSVDLSGYLDNTDSQAISLSTNVLSITGNISTVDLSPYLDNTDAQTLSLVTNTLSISNGNSVDLSGYVNTDAQTLSIDGSNNLSITGGNSVSLSAYLDNTDDQNITGGSFATGTGDLTIGIENGSSQVINLDGRYLTTQSDDQILTLDSTATQYTLSIEDGNSINWTKTVEIDPVFTASASASILAGDITNWNTAYGWGDHSTQGYLTSYTETDPIYTADIAGLSSNRMVYWDGSSFSNTTYEFESTAFVDWIRAVDSTKVAIFGFENGGGLLEIAGNSYADALKYGDVSAMFDNSISGTASFNVRRKSDQTIYFDVQQNQTTVYNDLHLKDVTADASELTALFLNGTDVVVTRELGSLAFLSTETQTLQDVTDLGATTTNAITIGNGSATQTNMLTFDMSDSGVAQGWILYDTKTSNPGNKPKARWGWIGNDDFGLYLEGTISSNVFGTSKIYGYSNLTAYNDVFVLGGDLTIRTGITSGGIGNLWMGGLNVAAEKINYAGITTEIIDGTDASEDGLMNFFTMNAGSFTNTFSLRSGKVGILKSNPGVALDVNGDVAISDRLYLSTVDQDNTNTDLLALDPVTGEVESRTVSSINSANTLQTVSDNGATTTNAVTINNNLTVQDTLFINADGHFSRNGGGEVKLTTGAGFSWEGPINNGVNGNARFSTNAWGRPGATSLSINGFGLISYDNQLYMGAANGGGGSFTSSQFASPNIRLHNNVVQSGTNESYLDISVTNTSEFNNSPYVSGANNYRIRTQLSNSTGTNRRAPLDIAAWELNFYNAGGNGIGEELVMSIDSTDQILLPKVANDGSEATALLIDANNAIVYRELGSNAFTSTAIPSVVTTDYFPVSNGSDYVDGPLVLGTSSSIDFTSSNTTGRLDIYGTVGGDSGPFIRTISNTTGNAIQTEIYNGAINLTNGVTPNETYTIGAARNDASNLILLTGGGSFGGNYIKAESNTNTLYFAVDNVGNTTIGGTITMNTVANDGAEATALLISGSNEVVSRELGSNAFTSATIGSIVTNNYVPISNGSDYEDSPLYTWNNGLQINETFTETGSNQDAGLYLRNDVTRNNAATSSRKILYADQNLTLANGGSNDSRFGVATIDNTITKNIAGAGDFNDMSTFVVNTAYEDGTGTYRNQSGIGGIVNFLEIRNSTASEVAGISNVLGQYTNAEATSMSNVYTRGDFYAGFHNQFRFGNRGSTYGDANYDFVASEFIIDAGTDVITTHVGYYTDAFSAATHNWGIFSENATGMKNQLSGSLGINTGVGVNGAINYNLEVNGTSGLLGTVTIDTGTPTFGDDLLKLDTETDDHWVFQKSVAASPDGSLMLLPEATLNANAEFIIGDEAGAEIFIFDPIDATAEFNATITTTGNFFIDKATPQLVLSGGTTQFNRIYFDDGAGIDAAITWINPSYAVTERQNDLELWSENGDVTFFTQSSTTAGFIFNQANELLLEDVDTETSGDNILHYNPTSNEVVKMTMGDLAVELEDETHLNATASNASYSISTALTTNPNLESITLFVNLSGAASSQSTITMPTPSSSYAGKRVTIKALDASSSYEIVVSQASTGLLVGQTSITNYPMSDGETQEFICMQDPGSTNYYWVATNAPNPDFGAVTITSSTVTLNAYGRQNAYFRIDMNGEGDTTRDIDITGEMEAGTYVIHIFNATNNDFTFNSTDFKDLSGATLDATTIEVVDWALYTCYFDGTNFNCAKDEN